MTKNRFAEFLELTRATPTEEIQRHARRLDKEIRVAQSEHAALNRVLKCRRRKAREASAPHTIH